MMRKHARPRPAILDVALPEGEPDDTADIHDALVIREGDMFLFMDENGNVPVGNTRGLGLYHADTRHLSGFNLYFHTSPPLVLLSTAELGFASEHVLTNPTLQMPGGQKIPRGTIEVRRRRVINGALEEQLQVTNYHTEAVDLRLHVDLAADFANIFHVRGLQKKRRRPVIEKAGRGRRKLVYEYEGIDGKTRRTLLTFDPPAQQLSGSGAILRARLRPHQTWNARIGIAVTDDGRPSPLKPERADQVQAVLSSYERWLSACTQISTDNNFFNRVLSRSLTDLRMLWLRTADGMRFPVAGTPWFDALFGRDGIIMGFQTLAFQPQIARETLKALARWQGTELDDERDEEPGKILHELRRGELSMSSGPTSRPYYGSVDSTLLFLMLIAAYYEWTGDKEFVRSLRKNVRAALDWIYRYGDQDGDGYVEYARRTPGGLENQGWKDSHDSVLHADGSLAQSPIALVEVQAYLYAAKHRLGPVLQVLGMRDIAARLEREAQTLRRRFHHDFWMPNEHFYALALDGGKARCETAASNPGHALWAGVVSKQRAEDTLRRMMADDMFSGWGIRTVSEHCPRYNPLAYHLGSVWPHDTAMAAFGFKMYGYEEEANQIASAMFDAAMSFPYYRLPELFAGESRGAHGQPVPYPIACQPQGWAAGSIPMLLHAMLGLVPDAPNRALRIVRPVLPDWLERVDVRGLRVGRGAIDLVYRRRGRRTQVEVTHRSGGIHVEMVRRWPM